MTEFWESVFKNNEKMWGENPTDNAQTVLRLLQKQNITNLLIPGFGYGRNAKVFYAQGFKVTGIEISKTAILRAQKHFGKDVLIHHGSVTDMPFNTNQYQAIYCYSLIHLLKKADRIKLISACYKQLEPKGLMIFVALTVNDQRFRIGKEVESNTFQSPNGLNLYFYDKAAVIEEFGNFNIIDTSEINEPEENPTEKHWMIICRKND